MTTLLSLSPALTMSSREIADLCEKQHKDVMRDIRVMLDELGETSAQFCADLPDGYGRAQPVFNLPKDLTITLVAGYNVRLRKRIIDRWMQLEAAISTPALPDLSDPAVLVQLLTEHASKRIEAERRAADAERKVTEIEPKARFYDDFASAEGRYTLQNAGRVLTGRPNKFIQDLKAKHLFYQNGDLVPYVQHRQAGLFEVKVEIINEKARTQTYVTPKGMAHFAKMMGGGNA